MEKQSRFARSGSFSMHRTVIWQEFLACIENLYRYALMRL
ncbi:hypothetical protein HMPREF9163_02148 [Selenomonas sp. oral taxon 138 str. F0429]|nr:hypothetical protein HMPREF9163_02148 [Selenomonas sp. oral taxon 138 str. F0429]